METLLARLSVVTMGAEPQEGGDCLRLDRRSEGITQYTNAPMTVFVPNGTVVATGSHFVKILGLFVDNTSKALLADQLGSFGMAAGFGMLSTQKETHKIKKPPNIHKSTKIL